MNDPLPDIHFNPDAYAIRKENARADTRQQAVEVLLELEERAKDGKECITKSMTEDCVLLLLNGGYDVELSLDPAGFTVWAKGAPNSPSELAKTAKASWWTRATDFLDVMFGE
jgi:hypothetical protein